MVLYNSYLISEFASNGSVEDPLKSLSKYLFKQFYSSIVVSIAGICGYVNSKYLEVSQFFVYFKNLLPLFLIVKACHAVVVLCSC